MSLKSVDSPCHLQQTPHNHRGKRYKSHPSGFTREENLRIGCLAVGTVSVLQSDV